MSDVHPHDTPPIVHTLLEAERDFPLESEELRLRVIRRAREVIPHMEAAAIVGQSRRVWGSPLAKAAAVLVLLSGMGAAAYELWGNRLPAPASAVLPAPAPSAAPGTILPEPFESVVPDQSSDGDNGPLVETSRPSRVLGKAGDSYARELRILKPAHNAVGRGAFDQALRFVLAHERQFPSGKLAEEREILRVRSLVGLGRNAEARSAAGTFRKRFPNSALLGRIQAMLGNGE